MRKFLRFQCLLMALGTLMPACSFSQMRDAHPHVLNGIYMTEKDFEEDRLSFASESPLETLHESWGGSIKLMRAGKVMQFKFGEFYGYRDRGFKFSSFGKKGTFHEYGYYQWLDQSGVTVYFQRIPHAKYMYTEEAYFSLHPGAEKYPLTIKNLKSKLNLDEETVKELKRSQRKNITLATVVNQRCVVNHVLHRDHQLSAEN